MSLATTEPARRRFSTLIPNLIENADRRFTRRLAETPAPKLTGDRCRCTACGQYFQTTNDFDRHRVGRASAGNRRCVSVAELLERGWSVRSRVFLTRHPLRGMTDADRIRRAARRQAKLPTTAGPA